MKYSEEFRARVVAEAKRSDIKRATVLHGVAPSSVYKWMNDPARSEHLPEGVQVVHKYRHADGTEFDTLAAAKRYGLRVQLVQWVNEYPESDDFPNGNPGQWRALFDALLDDWKVEGREC